MGRAQPLSAGDAGGGSRVWLTSGSVSGLGAVTVEEPLWALGAQEPINTPLPVCSPEESLSVSVLLSSLSIPFSTLCSPEPSPQFSKLHIQQKDGFSLPAQAADGLKSSFCCKACVGCLFLMGQENRKCPSLDLWGQGGGEGRELAPLNLADRGWGRVIPSKCGELLTTDRGKRRQARTRAVHD